MAVVIGTDSYTDEAALAAYAAARGITIAGDQSQLLIKAMDYLEMQSYIGEKTENAQLLEWPRSYTGLPDGTLYDENDVPLDIIKAQIILALIYDGGGDPLAAIARTVKREKVDVLEVEYSDNSASVTIYPHLSGLLAKYIGDTGGTSFKVSRG